MSENKQHKAYYGLPNEVKFCTKCVMSNQRPTSAIEFKHTRDSKKTTMNFDEYGVCDACKYSEKKHTIDWNKRRQELKNILEKYRNKNEENYDCLIPVSGGKDSHYQAYVIKKEFGLNPLVVNFHPREQTELGRKNLDNLKTLGVDCIEFSANPDVYKKLSLFGLTELGDPMWPEHRTISNSNKNCCSFKNTSLDLGRKSYI